MNKTIPVSATLLVLGLALGIGLYGAVNPVRSVTQTESSVSTQTVTQGGANSNSTFTQTVTSGQVSTTTSIMNQTVTMTQTQFVLSTFTQSTTRLVTETETATSTQTTTATVTQLSTTTYTAASLGEVLAVNNGTGEASSASFTAPVPEVRLDLNLTATGLPAHSNATWSIYEVGQPSPTCTGSVNGQQGVFSDFCYNLTIGANYYVQVDAYGATWGVDVIQIHN